MPQNIDFTADEVDFTVQIGAACDLIIDYAEDGVVVDVTGWSVRSDWKKKKEDTAVFQAVNGTVYNGPAGEFHYYFDDAALKTLLTANPKVASVYYDFWVKPPAGDWIPLIEGTINFAGSITNPHS